MLIPVEPTISWQKGQIDSHSFEVAVVSSGQDVVVVVVVGMVAADQQKFALVYIAVDDVIAVD
jgi:hypothetical protein